MTASIALNRLGLGARPGERAALTDPHAWVQQQLTSSAPPRTQMGIEARLVATFEAKMAGMDRMAQRQTQRAWLEQDIEAWWSHRTSTDAPVRARWEAFWSNHFTVSTLKRETLACWGPLQQEVIAPRCLGRFEDLLLAVVQHPAMLLYLDNQRSIGPNSRAARGRRGLNENLAREVLELHTLGVDEGYGQDDIIALAKILTGWTVARRQEHLGRGGFYFARRAHEPGSKVLLGQKVEEGLAAGEAAVRGLARHPSTARFISTKLAAHYIDDRPPASVIEALTGVWMDTGGHLGQVAATLMQHPLVWRPERRKLKDPQDLLTSLARGLPMVEIPAQRANRLGQPVSQALSPAGWDDSEAAWLGPEGMLGRIDLAVQLANKAFRQVPDPVALGEDLLGSLPEPTRRALEASKPRRSLVLLLASPSMQRR